MLDPHFLWHRERDPHLGLSWAFDQLPVRRPPAIRKGHFPALPCLKQEEPNWAQPTTIRSPLTSAHPTCAVSRASSPSPSFGLQSRTRSLTCDIRRAGAEFVVEESSETVERTPSTPPSTPKRCAPAPQPMQQRPAAAAHHLAHREPAGARRRGVWRPSWAMVMM